MIDVEDLETIPTDNTTGEVSGEVSGEIDYRIIDLQYILNLIDPLDW